MSANRLPVGAGPFGCWAALALLRHVRSRTSIDWQNLVLDMPATMQITSRSSKSAAGPQTTGTACGHTSRHESDSAGLISDTSHNGNNSGIAHTLRGNGPQMTPFSLRHANCPTSRCRGRRLSTGGIAAAVTGLALAGCNAAPSPPVSSATPETRSAGSSYSPGAGKNTRVRLATVTTIQSGGLLDQLVADFEAKTGDTVEVYAGDDPYTQARAGKADLVFSHLGHKDAQAFIQDGLGQWPQAVLSNTIGYIIPPGDPAHVASATDPVQAFERIAKSKSPFVLNNNEGLRYLTDTLWNAAGTPDKTGWYLDSGLQDATAMDAAAKANAYSLWGVTPFLEYQRQTHSTLQPVVINDSLMQRLMVSVAVEPAKVAGVNVDGAKAFQAYLLDPVTQAKIRAFRVPGVSQPLFWPQGRTNASAMLPGSTAGAGKTPGTAKGSSTAPTATP